MHCLHYMMVSEDDEQSQRVLLPIFWREAAVNIAASFCSDFVELNACQMVVLSTCSGGDGKIE